MKLHKHLFTALIISFMFLSVSAQTAKTGSKEPYFSLKSLLPLLLQVPFYSARFFIKDFRRQGFEAFRLQRQGGAPSFLGNMVPAMQKRAAWNGKAL